jgi:uncharacterized membrane protein
MNTRFAFYSRVLFVLVLFLAQWMNVSAGEPVVRAVLFWMEGCPHCHFVLDEVLPPLRAEYGGNLEILLVQLTDEESVNFLYQTAQSYGLAKEDVGVPFVIIGDRVLVGSEQIPAELPGLIAEHLADGGLEYPNLPGLDAFLPSPPSDSVTVTGPDDTQVRVTPSPVPATTGTFADGFGLAFAVMVAMVLSLAYSGLSLVRHSQRRPTAREVRAQNLIVPLIGLVGLGVAGYLTFVETGSAQAICGPVGDCNAVQNSPYSRLFGVLPIGLLGLFAYAAILSAWYLRRFHPRLIQPYESPLIFGMAFLGTLFSLYLTFLELFVIRAVCLWCLSSAVLITLLMLISLSPVRDSLRKIDWQALPF